MDTITATYKDGGMFHYEGGWPKDININDTEQTVRYRRKIEKDEIFVHTMLQLLPVNVKSAERVCIRFSSDSSFPESRKQTFLSKLILKRVFNFSEQIIYAT